MKSFPITCYDDFYENPDQVREFALTLDYTKVSGFFPGSRTQPLSTIDKDFCEFSCQRVLSIFGDYSETCDPNNYRALTQFQKISRFSSDFDDPVNMGWIHEDIKADLAAVIYLDPNPNLDNGTCIYRKDRPLPPSESRVPPPPQAASVVTISATSSCWMFRMKTLPSCIYYIVFVNSVS